MGRWFPVRQNARISTHLEAAIETGGQRHAVTVLSVSEGGVYFEGFDLEPLGESFRLEVCLDPAGPAWSPSPGAAGWRSRLGAGQCAVSLSIDVELLYVDLGEKDENDQAKVRLGGRFAGLSEQDLEHLRDFIARETFRATEWRTAGGAVPVSRHAAGGNEES
jgi:hypothetical protein